MFVLYSNSAPKIFHNDKRIFHHPKNSIKHIFHPFSLFSLAQNFDSLIGRKITEISRLTTALDRQRKIETNKAEKIFINVFCVLRFVSEEETFFRPFPESKINLLWKLSFYSITKVFSRAAQKPYSLLSRRELFTDWLSQQWRVLIINWNRRTGKGRKNWCCDMRCHATRGKMQRRLSRLETSRHARWRHKQRDLLTEHSMIPQS